MQWKIVKKHYLKRTQECHDPHGLGPGTLAIGSMGTKKGQTYRHTCRKAEIRWGVLPPQLRIPEWLLNKAQKEQLVSLLRSSFCMCTVSDFEHPKWGSCSCLPLHTQIIIHNTQIWTPAEFCYPSWDWPRWRNSFANDSEFSTQECSCSQYIRTQDFTHSSLVSYRRAYWKNYQW